MWPGISGYLKDFVAVKGAHSLMTDLKINWEALLSEAIRYSAMSKAMQKRMQEQWRGERGDEEVLSLSKAPFSLAVCPPDERIPDCTVEGYQFHWLRSSNEFIRAGRALKNCLTRWYTTGTDVLCIQKDGVYLAAVELIGDEVVQARGLENHSLGENPPLLHAFEMWKARHKLSESDEFSLDPPEGWGDDF
jgi:hypothetical protein